MYSQTFWKHYRRPRNRRALPESVSGEAKYHRCGDRLNIYLQLEDGHIKDASFEGVGCAPVVAVASLATEMLKGLKLSEARSLSVLQIDREIGGLPPSKRHAYLLLLECLATALQEESQTNPKEQKK